MDDEIPMPPYRGANDDDQCCSLLEQDAQLAARLGGLRGLERTYMIATLASSNDRAQRESLARTLISAVEGVGVRSALEALMLDVDANVRLAASRAWISRYGHVAV